LMFSITFKADWSLNNPKNWDNSIIIDICCTPPSCFTTKVTHSWHIQSLQSETLIVFSHNSSSNLLLPSTELTTTLLLIGFLEILLFNFPYSGPSTSSVFFEAKREKEKKERKSRWSQTAKWTTTLCPLIWKETSWSF
jgi:hypothetical protein